MSACNLAGVGLGTSGSSFDEVGTLDASSREPAERAPSCAFGALLVCGATRRSTRLAHELTNASSPPSEKMLDQRAALVCTSCRPGSRSWRTAYRKFVPPRPVGPGGCRAAGPVATRRSSRASPSFFATILNP